MAAREGCGAAERVLNCHFVESTAKELRNEVDESGEIRLHEGGATAAGFGFLIRADVA